MAANNTFGSLMPMFKEKYSTEKIKITPPKLPKKPKYPKIFKVLKY